MSPERLAKIAVFPLRLLFGRDIYLGKPLGYEVYMSRATVVLLLALGFIHWAAPLFLLCIYGIVLLHEFGHGEAARHLGYGNRGITLMPIGGVVLLENVGETPQESLFIALSGPVVNLWFCLVFECCILVSHEATVGLFYLLLEVNAGIMLWNMVPIYPLDGGRVFRAVLELLLRSEERAIWVSAWVAVVGAVGLSLWAVRHGRPMMVLIMVMVLVVNWAENWAEGARREEDRKQQEEFERRRPGLELVVAELVGDMVGDMVGEVRLLESRMEAPPAGEAGDVVSSLETAQISSMSPPSSASTSPGTGSPSGRPAVQ
jgi:Zn-dependent protease